MGFQILFKRHLICKDLLIHTYLGTLYEGAPTQLQHLVNDKKGNTEDVASIVCIFLCFSERLKVS